MEIMSSVYSYVVDYFVEDAYLMALQGVGLLLLFLAVWGTIAYSRQRNYKDFKMSAISESLFLDRVKGLAEIFRIALLFCLLGFFLVTCSIAAIYCSYDRVNFNIDVGEVLLTLVTMGIFYAFALFAIQLAGFVK